MFDCACVVFLTNFDYSICWISILNYLSFAKNFRVFNSPLSCLFSNFAIYNYLIIIFCIWIVFIEIWSKLYIVSEWFFLSVFVSIFCTCRTFDFLWFCFCCSCLINCNFTSIWILSCCNCYYSIVTIFNSFRLTNLFLGVIKFVF